MRIYSVQHVNMYMRLFCVYNPIGLYLYLYMQVYIEVDGSVNASSFVYKYICVYIYIYNVYCLFASQNCVFYVNRKKATVLNRRIVCVCISMCIAVLLGGDVFKLGVYLCACSSNAKF